jgi:P27 family predicted phage terminase small subunit
MPTPPKRSQNMRKHLTKAERESRKRAEAGMQHGKQTRLRVPGWLTEEAREVWRDTIRGMRGMDLLDKSDAGMLGIYCDVTARFRKESKALDDKENLNILPAAKAEMLRSAQSWARLAAQYAEKLGLTPNGKARLAKKRAEDKPKDELEELLDDVQDYMDQQ